MDIHTIISIKISYIPLYRIDRDKSTKIKGFLLWLLERKEREEKKQRVFITQKICYNKLHGIDVLIDVFEAAQKRR